MIWFINSAMENDSDDKSINQQFPVWFGYVMVIALELIVTAGLVVLQKSLPLGRFPIPYVLLMMMVAYFFGEGPAILAFVLGALAFNYFFVPPIGGLWPLADTPIGWAGYLALLIGTSIVGFATIMIRRSKQRVEGIANDLRASEEKYRTLFENLPVGVGIGDPDGTPFSMNQAGLRIHGFETEKEMLATLAQYAKVFELRFLDESTVPVEEWPALKAVRGEFVKDYEVYLHNFVKDDDRIVSYTTAPVRHSDGNINIIYVMHDITDRKHAEEALEKTNRQLLDRTQELDCVNEELQVANEEIVAQNEELIREMDERRQAQEALEVELKHKLKFYQRTIMAATDGKLMITEMPDIEQIAGPSIATWKIHGPNEICGIRHAVEEFARSNGIQEPRLGQLNVAVGEAITNVIKHAKTGEVSLHLTQDSLMVVSSDQGHGIPALALPEVALRRGYSTAGTLGMGYKLMIHFSDKIYLATDEDGTTVAIEIKLCPTPPMLGVN